jgi:hypothetical protein
MVDVEMYLLLELCEAFIWAAISEAGNSNELIFCSRGNSGSSIPVAVVIVLCVAGVGSQSQDSRYE